MPSSYICLACRRRLGQVCLDKAFQWQTRATFISLANNRPRTTTDEQLKDDLLELGESVAARNNGHGVAIPRPKPAYLPNQNNPADMLESIFEDIRARSAPVVGEPSQPVDSLDLYKKIEILKKMLSGQDLLRDSWSYFLEHFGPDNTRESFRNHKPLTYIYPTAMNLLKRLVWEKKINPLSQTLPSATEVSTVFLKLQMLGGRQWSGMITTLLEAILRTRQQPMPNYESEEELTADLLGAWNVVCRGLESFQHLPPNKTASLNWSSLPAISSKDALAYYQRRHRHYFFGLLMPGFPSRHFKDVPMLAIATFGLLASDSISGKAVSEASPFLVLLSRLLGVPALEIAEFTSTEVSTTAVNNYVQEHWLSIRDKARELSRQYPSESDKPNYRIRSNTNPQTKSTSFVTKLRPAFSRRNLYQVDTLWANAVRLPVVSGNATGADAATVPQARTTNALTEDECNYFIMVYMGLRQPHRATEVWNHMVKSGISPGLKTWDSMLSGCKASRDVKTLEEIWNKMKGIGVLPDVFCWTTRISALIACNQVAAGVRALDEMGRIWLEAAKVKYHKYPPNERLLKMGDIDGIVKPTIETINGAITALLGKQNTEAVYRILAWADKFGITPDIFTYNTLLRPLCRDGHTEDAMALLRQMKTASINPDVVTFTTIIGETFSNAADQTPEEQKELILSTFQEMEASGIEPNPHTYGQIIYSLLENSQGDMTATNAVLERMSKQGLEPSAHIFTILIEYQFAQSPPNFDTIRQLIQKAELLGRGADHVFWDRCVEGYARTGQTAAALTILGKVNRVKSKVGWLALGTLLHALAQNQEWDLAKTLVKNAFIDSGGPLPSDVPGKMGQHKFWGLVRELKLLD